jgi:hypothetical protein
MDSQKKMPTEKVAFNLGPRSVQMDLLEAREKHINYLKHGPWVFTDVGGNDQIVHSLLIDAADLQILYDKGKGGGIRLYFCKHDQHSNYLNLIAVPVKDTGENEVRNKVGGKAPVVNTLEPCPTVCPDFSTEDLNCQKRQEDQKHYWCRPNHTTVGMIWFEDAGTPTNEPAQPYVE